MLFGFGNRNQSVRRGGMFGGGLRNAALAGAGMLALRWWRNRRASPQAGRFEDSRESARNPVHGWQ
jgi:hypothetical protein